MFHPSHVTLHSVQRVELNETDLAIKRLLVPFPLSLWLGLTEGKPSRKPQTLHLLHLCRVHPIAIDHARIFHLDASVLVGWSKPRFLIFQSRNFVILRSVL